MLRKNNFEWSDVSTKAFEAVKSALTSTPVLALPDFSKTFYVECDASGNGIGAVLTQNKHLIAFLSKSIAPKHQSLSVYDK